MDERKDLLPGMFTVELNEEEYAKILAACRAKQMAAINADREEITISFRAKPLSVDYPLNADPTLAAFYDPLDQGDG